VVKQNDIGSHVLDLPVLAIKRGLGRMDEQAEHKCSNGCDAASAEPHNILCVVGEMVAWQCAPKEYSDKYTTHDGGERHQRQSYGAHDLPSGCGAP